jgi:hypothetical protein
MTVIEDLNPETPPYSVNELHAILDANSREPDYYEPTYLVGILGEKVPAYKAVCIKRDGKFVAAKADGIHQPVAGLTLETGSAGDSVRIQRIGPIASPTWNWSSIGGFVYIDPSVPGNMTANRPLQHEEVLGIVLSSQSVFLICNNPA